MSRWLRPWCRTCRHRAGWKRSDEEEEMGELDGPDLESPNKDSNDPEAISLVIERNPADFNEVAFDRRDSAVSIQSTQSLSSALSRSSKKSRRPVSECSKPVTVAEVAVGRRSSASAPPTPASSTFDLDMIDETVTGESCATADMDAPTPSASSSAPSATVASNHGQVGTLAEAEMKVKLGLLRGDSSQLVAGGEAMLLLQEFGKAAGAFGRAIEIGPLHAKAHRGMGEAMLLSQEFGKAEAAFSRAIEVGPPDAKAYRGMTKALQGQRRWLKAFSTTRVALEKLPGNKELEELQEEARSLYKANKSAPAAVDPGASPAFPKLTKEQAREVLSSAIEIFERKENYDRLKAAVAECHEKHFDQIARTAALQATLFPMVSGMLQGLMAQYGFSASNMFDGMAQVQFLACGDTDMQPKVQRIMSVLLMGKLE